MLVSRGFQKNKPGLQSRLQKFRDDATEISLESEELGFYKLRPTLLDVDWLGIHGISHDKGVEILQWSMVFA